MSDTWDIARSPEEAVKMNLLGIDTIIEKAPLIGEFRICSSKTI